MIREALKILAALLENMLPRRDDNVHMSRQAIEEIHRQWILARLVDTHPRMLFAVANDD